MESVKSYKIHSESMVLRPVYNESGKLCTIVDELYQKILVLKSPYSIVRESLNFYGGGYEGTIEAAKKILGNKKMLPICIAAPLDIYFIPMTSAKSHDCIWFALNHMVHVESSTDKMKSLVNLKNGQNVVVNLQKGIVESKRYRAAYLKETISRRLEERCCNERTGGMVVGR
ncbi:competence protein ComK [Anaerobacillus sp. MEB173]|uniref:competence protein ComK n=1 Tax=Anaerobacillus sp. MEB173 TaxID=3383345 RepID=UPI003F91F4F8